MTNEQQPQLNRLGQYAGFTTRLVGWIIDDLILVSIIAVTTALAGLIQNSLPINDLLGLQAEAEMIIAGFLVVLLLTIPPLYFISFWMLTGQTPGKRVMGLRIVRTDGERMRFGNCVRRLIGYWISDILLLGYLWVLVDNRRQGFHDKIAGTFVVYAWPEVGPPVTPARDRLRDFRQRREAARTPD